MTVATPIDIHTLVDRSGKIVDKDTYGDATMALRQVAS
jgi:hypothetical protein